MSKKASIAIVDDNNAHRTEVCRELTSFYDVTAYDDIKPALQGLRKYPPSLVMVGEKTASSTGLGFIKSLRQESTLTHIPVIYIMEGEELKTVAAAKVAGANHHIAKPYRRSKLIKIISAEINAEIEQSWEGLQPVQRQALKGTVKIFNNIADIVSSGEALPFSAVKDACQPLVEAVSNNDFKNILSGVKNYDDYTYAHSLRVATLLSLLGHAAGFNKDEQLLLASGGLLHDVGKMTIPIELLNKPGRLTVAEFEIMKTHVPETVKHLKANSDIPNAVLIIAEQHHEKLNGKGYPHGLKGAQLNELARMSAIVDVFSAMTDRRVYKAEMDEEKAIGIMEDEMGEHLDQRLIQMFKEMLSDAKIIS